MLYLKYGLGCHKLAKPGKVKKISVIKETLDYQEIRKEYLAFKQNHKY